MEWPLISSTHLVLIPSFNPGRLLAATLRAARAAWAPVWIVTDGSTDGSDHAARAAAGTDPAIRLLRRSRNGGKGRAVRTGLDEARASGFTHALVMDADGQHPPDLIADFMGRSEREPDAMVLGVPIFGPDAPSERVHARKLSNWAARLAAHRAVGDALFGFRVYPIAPLLEAFGETRGMRGYDFDAEALVRLTWRGVPAITLPAPVRYPSRAQGGVSHFSYWRHNALLASMHARLALEAIRRAC